MAKKGKVELEKVVEKAKGGGKRLDSLVEIERKPRHSLRSILYNWKIKIPKRK